MVQYICKECGESYSSVNTEKCENEAWKHYYEEDHNVFIYKGESTMEVKFET